MAANLDLGSASRCASSPYLQGQDAGHHVGSGPESFYGHTVKKITEKEEPEVYREIVRDFERAGQSLIQVDKIINAAQEGTFQYEIDHLTRTKLNSDFQLNIRSLYHGTRAPVEQICDEGLDGRLSRKGRFGKGIYFSDNPTKCCKYAEKANGPSFLLRCKVILGDIKEYPDGEHDRNNLREPVKEYINGKRVYYDSVKGKPRDHVEYVIYEKRRALIEYVIYYQSVNNDSEANGIRFKARGGGDSDDSGDCSGSATPTSGGSGDESADSDGNASDESDSGRPNVATAATAATAAVKVFPQRKRRETVANASSSSKPSTSSLTSVVSAPQLNPTTVLQEQTNAVKHLLAIKGTVSETDMKELIVHFKKMYCRSGCPVDQSIITALKELESKDDPVMEVTESRAREFSEVTNCNNMEECRRYVLDYPDMDQAVTAYFDHMSFR